MSAVCSLETQPLRDLVSFSERVENFKNWYTYRSWADGSLGNAQDPKSNPQKPHDKARKNGLDLYVYILSVLFL